MKVVITEQDFMGQVIELAHIFHWLCVHFRSVHIQRSNGSTYYQTPVQADGEGFPDLILLRDKTILAVELKSEKGKVRQTQKEWLEKLARAGIPTYIWRPSDFDDIVKILR